MAEGIVLLITVVVCQTDGLLVTRSLSSNGLTTSPRTQWQVLIPLQHRSSQEGETFYAMQWSRQKIILLKTLERQHVLFSVYIIATCMYKNIYLSICGIFPAHLQTLQINVKLISYNCVNISAPINTHNNIHFQPYFVVYRSVTFSALWELIWDERFGNNFFRYFFQPVSSSFISDSNFPGCLLTTRSRGCLSMTKGKFITR